MNFISIKLFTKGLPTFVLVNQGRPLRRWHLSFLCNWLKALKQLTDGILLNTYMPGTV